MEVNMERKVVVSCMSGSYIGDVPTTLPERLNGSGPTSKVSPEEYMATCYRENEPVQLLNARCVHAERGVRAVPPSGPGQPGRILGVESFSILTVLHQAKGPVSKVYLSPSSWLFPKDDEALEQGYTELLKKADEVEKIASASEVLDLHTKAPHLVRQ